MWSERYGNASFNLHLMGFYGVDRSIDHFLGSEKFFRKMLSQTSSINVFADVVADRTSLQCKDKWEHFFSCTALGKSTFLRQLNLGYKKFFWKMLSQTGLINVFADVVADRTSLQCKEKWEHYFSCTALHKFTFLRQLNLGSEKVFQKDVESN